MADRAGGGALGGPAPSQAVRRRSAGCRSRYSGSGGLLPVAGVAGSGSVDGSSVAWAGYGSAGGSSAAGVAALLVAPPASRRAPVGGRGPFAARSCATALAWIGGSDSVNVRLPCAPACELSRRGTGEVGGRLRRCIWLCSASEGPEERRAMASRSQEREDAKYGACVRERRTRPRETRRENRYRERRTSLSSEFVVGVCRRSLSSEFALGVRS